MECGKDPPASSSEKGMDGRTPWPALTSPKSPDSYLSSFSFLG